MDQRLRRQLRLVDRRAHDLPQPADLPAPAPEHGFDEEDAVAAARNQIDSGPVRQVQADRSRAPENESGDDGALQTEGRQSGERLSADAADVTRALRVLCNALGGD